MVIVNNNYQWRKLDLMTAMNKNSPQIARYKIIDSAVGPYFWAHHRPITVWAVAITTVAISKSQVLNPILSKSKTAKQLIQPHNNENKNSSMSYKQEIPTKQRIQKPNSHITTCSGNVIKFYHHYHYLHYILYW